MYTNIHIHVCKQGTHTLPQEFHTPGVVMSQDEGRSVVDSITGLCGGLSEYADRSM